MKNTILQISSTCRVNVGILLTSLNKMKNIPLLCIILKHKQCDEVDQAAVSEHITNNTSTKLSMLDAMFRGSGRVFMALIERKRHFPSAARTQRGQFSKSSALFRFMGLAVHSQVSEAFYPSWGFFLPLHNKTRSHRGTYGKIYHLMSTWGQQMRSYLPLFWHMYLCCWFGCHKETGVCLSFNLKYTLFPTVISSCTAVTRCSTVCRSSS